MPNPGDAELNHVVAVILRTRRPLFPLLLFLLLTTCADVEPKPTVSESLVASCEVEFFFDDGTGDGNGELCVNSDYGAYGDLAIEVYHYRSDWWLYAEVNVQSVCENVLCNLQPSSLCVSAAQFWTTNDDWHYAVCRTDDTGVEMMSFWRRQGTSGVYTHMEDLELAYYCEP